MKKIFLSMIALSLIGFSAMAQNDQTTSKAGQSETKTHGKYRETAGNLKNIDLTDAQKQQMKSIRQTYKTQMQDLQKNESITVKEQRERREALVKQQRGEIDKILTPEQRAKVQQDTKAFGGKRTAMKTGQAEKVAKQLDLTSTQQTQMKSLNENLKTKMQQIQQNDALTKEQKKEQMQSLHKQHKDDVAGILTGEQKQKMEALKNSRKSKAL